MGGASDVRAAVEAIWRIESPKIVARLVRIVRDLSVAEDLAQDALVAALESWPESGVPANPGAWLTAAAKHRAIDHVRRDRRFAMKKDEILRSRDRPPEDPDAALDDEIGDELLRLVFLTCHPALSVDAQTALTLRLFGGLTTAEVARAYLAPTPTIAQRIVRAKQTLAENGTPFELPRGPELAPRLAGVLRVVYLVFNEGYTASSGPDWMRPDLCLEALRIARILAALLPEESEVHGLAALLEIQASRLRTRVGPAGEIVRLFDQDRTRWDQLLIRRGLTSLGKAERIGPPYGPRVVEAAIAACHARARTPADTDWPRIAALYGELSRITPSPVVSLNRAVAVSMAEGPQAGLDLLTPLLDEPSLRNYHLLPAVHGDLLSRLGRTAEARSAFERAAAMAGNARERALLEARAAALPA